MRLRSLRGRKTGRFESGRHYALLLDEILRDVPFRKLPHSARTLFCAMAAQYRGANNGDISMTAKMAAAYGIRPAELAAGILLLETTGLIQRTRQGCFTGGKSICTLWALTCWNIDPSEKYDQPLKVQLAAPNTWTQWKEPDDWPNIVRRAMQKARGRQFPSPQRGEQAVPHAGEREWPNLFPTWGTWPRKIRTPRRGHLL